MNTFKNIFVFITIPIDCIALQFHETIIFFYGFHNWISQDSHLNNVFACDALNAQTKTHYAYHYNK